MRGWIICKFDPHLKEFGDTVPREHNKVEEVQKLKVINGWIVFLEIGLEVWLRSNVLSLDI
jgi:hypothetical protein